MPKTGGNVRMPSSIKQSSSSSAAVAARVLTKAEKDRLRVERGTGLSQVTGGVSPVPVLQPQQPFEWHKITGTESVGSIAGMYGMDPQTLVGFNGLNLNPPAGSWIKIPQVKTNQLSIPTTPQNLTPSVQVPSAMPQPTVPQSAMPTPQIQGPQPMSGAGNIKTIRNITPPVQPDVSLGGRGEIMNNITYRAEYKGKLVNAFFQELEMTNVPNTDYLPSNISNQEMDIVGLGPTDIEYMGGVYNPNTGWYELPSTAPWAKISAGQKLSQALEKFVAGVTVKPEDVPYFISDDDIVLYNKNNNDFNAKFLQKIGGRRVDGGFVFPNSQSPDNPKNQGGLPSGGEPVYKKKKKGGGGGGGGAVVPTGLEGQDLEYFNKLLNHEVQASTAIAQLEQLIASGMLSQEQLDLANAELARLKAAADLALATSYGNVASIWRIG